MSSTSSKANTKAKRKVPTKQELKELHDVQLLRYFSQNATGVEEMEAADILHRMRQESDSNPEPSESARLGCQCGNCGSGDDNGDRGTGNSRNGDSNR